MSLLVQFVVLLLVLYDRTSDLVKVNDARKWMFTQIESILPTQAALTQHIKWASYQANCWNLALTLAIELPSPKDWGGERMTQDGIYYGPHFQKYQTLVMNYYNML